MAYKNKTYLSFDGDNDIQYYYLMKAWKANQNDFFQEFNFYDAHEINTIKDTYTEATIKNKLSEKLENSKLFVLLVGEKTKFLYKYVRWEIEQAIALNIPIVVVNLNGMRQMDDELCPAIVKKQLALHVSFNVKIIEKALKEWPGYDAQYKAEEKSGAYYYNDSTYHSLGL